MKLWSRQTVLVLLSAVCLSSPFSLRGHAQENSGVDLAKEPCVTASSPCPLDFGAMPDSLMPQVMKAKGSYEGGDFVGAQKELEALREVQPESRTILYDLALVSLKQGQRDQALGYQQQALRGVTHPYQRKVLDELGQEILYGRGVTDKASLSLAEVLPTPVGLSRDPAERCRCSKIMSPPNCNETLSPYEDGDDESERVPTGESD